MIIIQTHIMNRLKTGYAYLFYFFFNSINKVKGNILVQFKALFMITILGFVLLASIATYYLDFSKVTIPPNFNILYLLVPIIPLVGLNLWFFERNENWKGYISEFSAWPEAKQRKWNRVMRFIVFFVFANLIFSFYLMSQIDWRQYR